MIAQETIAAVQQAAQIVDVVGAVLPLKRSGSGYKALCPFHPEKTPSFHVNPGLGIFKCFGCGKAGDPIRFVQEYERVSFAEAIEMLADRYGIEVRYTSGGAGPGRADLLRAQEFAMRHFRRALLGPGGGAARDYLRRRGVRPETSERFQIGFAADEWDGLWRAMRRAGFREDVLAASGLFARREDGRPYDLFRGRVMFPVLDAQGRPIAFGGRRLDEESQGKYINSPETPLFQKSRVLYGVHLIHETREPLEALIVVEGYFDVVLPAQAGLRGFVAPLGTAFGAAHARAARRWAGRIVLLFDADEAGSSASKRALEALWDSGADIRVAALPPGTDPADLAVERAGELAARIAESREMFDYLLDLLEREHDLRSPRGRAAAVGAVVDALARIAEEPRREVYLARVDERWGVARALLAEEVNRRLSEPARAGRPRPEVAQPADPDERCSRQLVAVMLAKPDLARRVREQFGADLEGVPGAAARRAARAVLDALERGDPVRPAAVLARLGSDEAARSVVVEAIEFGLEEERAEWELDRIVAAIEARRRARAAQEALAAARGGLPAVSQEELLRRLTEMKRTSRR